MPIDLTQVAEAVGLPIRRVRYVLEHRVLPGAEKASRGHRVTRTFTGLEGLGIALAAVMLESGLRRQTVSALVRAMLKGTKGTLKPGVPLIRIYNTTGSLSLEIADGANYRVIGRSARGLPSWVQLSTGAALKPGYEPLAVIHVDAGRVRDAIRRAAGE
jgi:hypothetical protein